MSKVAEVRTQIYLSEQQHRELRRVANQRETSMAQVVRDAVDGYLARTGGADSLDDETFRNDPIWNLPERARDFGRGDAARNHDALLYGPKDS